MAPDDIPALIRSLIASDSRIREVALRDLRKKRKEPLLTALRSDDWAVRNAAIDALVALGDPTVVPDLIHVLDHRASMTREAAVRALGKLGDRSVIPHLVRKLRDPKGYVRSAALLSLAELKAGETVPVLLKQLDDEPARMKWRVAWALGALGDETVVAHLLPLLNRPEQHLANAALQAIARIDGQTFHERPRRERAPAARSWWQRVGKHKYAPKEAALPPSNVSP